MADETNQTPGEVKNPWVSKGVIGAALATVFGVLILFGVGVQPEDATVVGDAVDSALDKIYALGVVVTSLIALWGRIVATSKIKFPWQKD